MKEIEEMQDKIKRKFDLYTSDVLKTYNLSKEVRYQVSLLDSLDVRLSKHAENVASITNKLCNYLNLNQEFIEYVTTCAYIHDIGKLYIPRNISKKPVEDLDGDELEEYKKHAEIGFNICRKDDALRRFLAGSYYHHEQLDGSGFPQGLKAKDIPFEAKIIAVANMYENLLNEDPYNEKRKIDVLVEMKKERLDKKIDRKVFKALVKMVRDETEQELYSMKVYINHLKNEIDRFKKALKHYNIYIKSKSISKKQYHELYTKGFLTSRENVEDTPKYLKDTIEAYNDKRKEYNKLRKEYRAIRSFIA